MSLREYEATEGYRIAELQFRIIIFTTNDNGELEFCDTILKIN